MIVAHSRGAGVFHLGSLMTFTSTLIPSLFYIRLTYACKPLQSFSVSLFLGTSSEGIGINASSSSSSSDSGSIILILGYGLNLSILDVIILYKLLLSSYGVSAENAKSKFLVLFLTKASCEFLADKDESSFFINRVLLGNRVGLLNSLFYPV